MGCIVPAFKALDLESGRVFMVESVQLPDDEEIPATNGSGHQDKQQQQATPETERRGLLPIPQPSGGGGGGGGGAGAGAAGAAAAAVGPRRAARGALRALARLHHPNLQSYLGADWTSGPGDYGHIFSELVFGQSIQSLLDQLGALPENIICHYIGQVLEGLAYLHRKGFAHGALGPRACRLTQRGRLKLTNFWAAPRLAAALARRGLPAPAVPALAERWRNLQHWDAYCAGDLALAMAMPGAGGAGADREEEEEEKGGSGRSGPPSPPPPGDGAPPAAPGSPVAGAAAAGAADAAAAAAALPWGAPAHPDPAVHARLAAALPDARGGLRDFVWCCGEAGARAPASVNALLRHPFLAPAAAAAADGGGGGGDGDGRGQSSGARHLIPVNSQEDESSPGHQRRLADLPTPETNRGTDPKFTYIQSPETRDETTLKQNDSHQKKSMSSQRLHKQQQELPKILTVQQERFLKKIAKVEGKTPKTSSQSQQKSEQIDQRRRSRLMSVDTARTYYSSDDEEDDAAGNKHKQGFLIMQQRRKVTAMISQLNKQEEL